MKPQAADSLTHDYNGFFRVEQVDKSFKQAIARRRPVIRPLAGVTNYDVNEIKKQAFHRWGLSEYEDCWTFEMPSRPIPFVSTDTRPLRVLEKFEAYIEHVLNVILPRMTPHIQTFNKISKIGYPINTNPEADDGTLLKMEVLNEYFEPLSHNDDSGYEDSFSTIGIRLQNEPPSKKRTFQFITDEGSIVQRDVDRRQLAESTTQLGRIIPSRTRTVVNPALINLYIQAFDTMLHRAIMKFPLCEANVYTKVAWPANSEFASFDCKHYERYLGMVVFKYCDTIGGLYGKWLSKLARDPFLVPSDTWRTQWLVTPIFSRTVFPQFSSGLCCVSTLGKLANMCVQVGYFVEHQQLGVQEAVNAVLAGEHDGLRRWMYGDDNRLLGPKAKRDSFIKYMGEHFDVEEDEVPTYLGTKFRSDVGRFLLPRDTYNLKLYCPERDFTFKTYPNLGYIERRKTFAEYGEPEIARDVIPFEDELLDSIGAPFHQFVVAAVKEQLLAKARGESINALIVTDKEYLMTPEEQLTSGMFWGLPASRTREIVLQIVSDSIKERLTFK